MKNRTLTQISFPHGWLAILKWAVWCIVLTGATHTYGQKPDGQKVEESLKRVQQWQHNQQDRSGSDVRLLADAGATQAIPALKQEFEVTKDNLLKLNIASGLVKLGDKDPVYWDFLADKAIEAVENDAPSVFLLNAEGKTDRNSQFSPEFIAWAKAHNMEPSAAAQMQMFDLPVNFLCLAEIGDARGRDLLRMGLRSRNIVIVSFAARGLAKLKDKNSIPLIIETCAKLSRQQAYMIAIALVFFDDPRAQTAAETLIDKPLLEELRRQIRERSSDPFLY